MRTFFERALSHRQIQMPLISQWSNLWYTDLEAVTSCNSLLHQHMLRQLHACYPAAIKSSHTWTVIKENSTKAIPIVLTISWTKKLQFPNKTRPFVHPLSHSDYNISWCQGKRSNLQLTVCKLNVCTCSLVPCSTGKRKTKKQKNL